VNPLKKSERRMLLAFVLPVTIFYLFIYAYPTVNTVIMTFYKIPGIAAGFNLWHFVGINNYIHVLNDQLFQTSYVNVFIIMLVGGIFTVTIAMIFALVLNKGIFGRKFWKSMIYLPNLISPVALVVMWTQYVFNHNFGFFKTFFDYVGLHSLANIPWTSAQYSFCSMLIAYTFCGMGFYMVVFMAALNKIPDDLPASASLEGASGLQILFRIKLPLIKDVIKINMIFWCINAINMFLWSKVFSVTDNDPTTLSPANYMYTLIFGNSTGNVTNVDPNVGLGAVIGVILCVSVVLIFALFGKIFGNEKYEY
jgi:ABC-type sugar transport system permease subunit